MSRKLTLDEFIAKSRAVHGDKYDYSFCEYRGNKEKVRIICPKHGEFTPTPNRHMRGDGCRACGYESLSQQNTKTTEHFIEQARKIHGDRFGYDKTEYRGRRFGVVITCKTHGDFEMPADSHLSGRGCQRCALESRSSIRSKPFDVFLTKARAMHGDRYIYVESTYTRSKDKVTIVCPDHGLFDQEAYAHTTGKKCPQCAIKDNAKAKIADWSRAGFLALVDRVHGGKYSYDSAVYRGYKEKITVTCPVHGDFESWYYNHVNGCGCPLCALSYDQPFKVYVLLADNGLVKIGVAKSIDRRTKELCVTTPFNFRVAAQFQAENYPHALSIEREAHNQLARYRAGMSGFDGATEWFECDVGEAISIVSDIKAAS